LRFHYHLPPPILQSYIKTEFCSSYVLLYQTESGNIKQKIGIMRRNGRIERVATKLKLTHVHSPIITKSDISRPHVHFNG